jgi:hypothetical protein
MKSKKGIISKLSRWLPYQRSHKLENTVTITIYVISILCILLGLFLGYYVWQVGFNNATVAFILLILCIAAGAGLLIYRRSIKFKLT